MRTVIISDPPYGCSDFAWDKHKPPLEILKAYSLECTAMVLCCNHKLLADLIRLDMPLPFWDMIVWNKTPARTWVSWSKPLRSMELVAFFGDAKQFDFRKTLEPQAAYPRSGVLNGHLKPNGGVLPVGTDKPKVSFPVYQQIWQIPVVPKRERLHPTQKPAELMRRLVSIVSLAGSAIVVDPFEGSGSTGVACSEFANIEYRGSDNGGWLAE